jgi:hypothetical protein
MTLHVQILGLSKVEKITTVLELSNNNSSQNKYFA